MRAISVLALLELVTAATSGRSGIEGHRLFGSGVQAAFAPSFAAKRIFATHHLPDNDNGVYYNPSTTFKLHCSVKDDEEEWMVSSSSSSSSSSPPKINHLQAHKRVALQDPEWYNEFVVNILGKETVLQSGLPPSVLSATPPPTTTSSGMKDKKPPSAENKRIVAKNDSPNNREEKPTKEWKVADNNNTTKENIGSNIDPSTKNISSTLLSSTTTTISKEVKAPKDNDNMVASPVAVAVGTSSNNLSGTIRGLTSDASKEEKSTSKMENLVSQMAISTNANTSSKLDSNNGSVKDDDDDDDDKDVELLTPSTTVLSSKPATKNQEVIDNAINVDTRDSTATNTSASLLVATEKSTSIPPTESLQESKPASKTTTNTTNPSNSTQKSTVRISNTTSTEGLEASKTKSTSTTEPMNPSNSSTKTFTGVSSKTPTPRESLETATATTPKSTGDGRQAQETTKQKQTLIGLGYSTDEIKRLLPEVIDVILEDEITRPSSGIPPKWIDSDVKTTLPSPPSRIATQSQQRTARPTSDESAQYQRTQQLSDQKDVGPPTKSSSDFGTNTTKTKEETKTPQYAQTQGISEESASREGESPKVTNDEVLVFFDSSQKKFRLTPLSRLTALGYDRKDLIGLPADIVATVLTNNTPRPAKGIPRRWKSSMDNTTGATKNAGEVQILPSRSDAEALLKSGSLKIPSRKATKEPPTGDDRRRRQKVSVAGERVDDRSGRSSRRKRAFNADGSRKNVYDARQKRADSTGRKRRERMVDPPKPKTFWIGMDRFRDLLRREAEMRVSILGDDFAPSIKEEMDWRLGLYSDWLWIIDKGVGDFPVPSRSQRGRGPPMPKREGDGPSPRKRTRRPKK